MQPFDSIYKTALGISNRPDLIALHKDGIARALKYYHSLEDFDKDKVSPLNTEFDVEICGSTATVIIPSGISLSPNTEVYLNGKEICKLEGCNPNDLGYRIQGNCLIITDPDINICNELDLCFDAKKLPCFDRNTCDISSWVATAYPEMIGFYAGEYVNSMVEKRTANYRTEDVDMFLRNELEI